MENKIYFTVQDNRRINIGDKTYVERNENITHYKEEDVKKAIRHFRKRKANDIIMHRIEYLDDVPYVKDSWCFGEEVYEMGNGYYKEYVYFKELNAKYEIKTSILAM